MADIRISKLLRQFNIGLDDLVEFLHKQGVEIDANPNAKVSDELLPAISTQFGKDLELKQAADKVEVKITEILEKSGRKQAREQEEEEEPEQETIIKSNTFINSKKETPQPVEKPVPVQPEEPEEPEVPEEPEEPELPEEPETPEPVETAPEAPRTEEPQAPAVEEPGKPEVPDETSQTPVEAEAPQPDESQPETAPEETEVPVAEPAPQPAGAPKKTDGPALKVVGKIDLSQFDRKPKKRERISKGTQKVDVAKAGANIEKNPKKDGGRSQQNQQAASGKGRKRDRDRFKPALTEAQQEELQKEIQKQVKETYAKMNEGKKNNFGAKYRKEKREAAAQRTQEEMAEAMAEQKVLKVTEFVTVNDLATLMNNTPVVKVIGACMSLGLMVSINQRLDAETLVLVAEEFGYKVEFVTAEISEEINSNEEADRPEDLQPRPPIITVMGHVDHGKTSLLDYIRKAHVAAGESGGITQHIGAYQVERQGRAITFLDTPGHEAFTAMRARGANLTDIAVIVIAADDGIMPQTKEAIQHAQAAKVSMIVAINKCDLRTANPDRVKRQLQQMGLAPEDWGGDLICCNVSAQTGEGIDQLLEMILLQAEMLELKANPRCKATGYVIESCLEAGRGPTATVLVKNGTLQLNDAVVSGSCWGRIKAMINDQGHKVRTAPPSAAVKLLGLTSVPMPGSEFVVYKNDREARQVAESRAEAARLEALSDKEPAHSGPLTLADLLQAQAGSDKRKLSVILKTDVQGSLEALQGAMEAIKSEKVDLEIVGTGVGNVSVNDVLLATASQAVILGFHVAKDNGAGAEAKRRGVEIRLYSIIYEMLDDVKNLMTGLLDPIIKEHVNGHASIRQIFDMGKRGKVAGCMCMKGKVTLKGRVRVKRKDEILYEGKIQSLRRFQNEASEVREGQECGIVLDHFTNFVEGDVIESYEVEKVAQSL